MKKQRTDSISGQVTAMQNASLGMIKPPAHIKLRDGDIDFWNSVVSARARDTWNNADLENAANLARCKADIERLQSEITKEGDIIANDRGTQIINPKHTLLETLSRRAVALSRMLHVHAEATVGKSEDAAKSLQSQNDAINNRIDDELIQRLRVIN